MSQIEHIVFDIGRVLIHWDPELPYIDLIPDVAERQAFLRDVCSPDWNVEQDRGRDWREAENLLIADHPQKADLIRAYRQRWHMSVPHAFEDVVGIYLGLIEGGRDVTLLTNFNQHTYLEAQEKFPFLAKARGVTVSGRVQLIKPDPAIYSHHAEAHGLEPSRTVFIDDSAANVQSAKAAGWQAVHFAGNEGAGKLKMALEDMGIR